MAFRYLRTFLLLFLIIALVFTPVSARDTNNPVPQHEIKMAEFFYPDNAVSHIYHASIQPHWVRSDAFWYSDNSRDTTMFYIVNVSQGVKKRLLDTVRFAPALAQATGKEIHPSRLPIQDMELSPDEQTFTFSAFGSRWNCDVKTSRVSQYSVPADVTSGVLSPDKSHIAYVNESNLWLYDTRTGLKEPLTVNGTENYFYGKRSDTVRYPVSESRLNQTPSPYIVWSPDSTKIATYKVDQRNVSPLWLIQDAPDIGKRPVLYSYRYAYPGDAQIPQYEPVVIDTRTKQEIFMNCRSQPEVSMMDTDTNLLQWWDQSGNSTYMLFIERGEKMLRLLSGNAQTGVVRELLHETGKTYIESNLQYADRPNVAVLKNGEIIWFSERDGWGHLYRYNPDGTLKNQITSGPWVVREILAVDETNGHIYFTGSGKEGGNPYYRYLYRVQLDGNDLKLLTPGQADHAISIAPDLSCFIDAYSRADLPTVTVLRSMNGTQVMHLASADDSDLRRTGWSPAERITMTARDGKTEIYGLLFKPTNFDNTKKYPVIDVVYPGPYTIVTATGYPADLSWNSKIYWTCQMLSELGYVVVTMDGLGTAYRSKSFHDVSYGNLADCGLPDHIAGLKQLVSRYPYMDISRIGIYGKSAGGYMAAQAMLTYPDFFKVGVAASGDHDCRLYGSFWGEKYQGYPVTGSYADQAAAVKADNLKGNLLLMTGDMDDNVHPSMTMQLADSLESAGKKYEIMVFSNMNHDLNYDPYYLKTMMRYFVQHL
ncbi:DPP IV N-terminal domain-containing protein [Methanospirillum sp. J.3.6.1-F.2.7.3]|uniref:DPP IV N-terminal domain-containing protein n=1 Tax=Methanospirillum purgamenti TaxID=2834276 RepID=A0A8E7AZA1_9EURY|nr:MULTISPECIES: DPP IV N-terminal domain-containing protein [Methanospirillum]MDX8550469.1 DPP IV N-terminal domain-containing protein [Methanospirillum hungatei]QVV88163.1 DPP IV N-terminal domain-containing protein [Methanospirillum sp. J.3.6.1-F.2.7.3]